MAARKGMISNRSFKVCNYIFYYNVLTLYKFVLESFYYFIFYVKTMDTQTNTHSSRFSFFKIIGICLLLIIGICLSCYILQGICPTLRPPSRLLFLSTTTQAEIVPDTIELTLAREIRGSDPKQLSDQLNQKVSQALAQTTADAALVQVHTRQHAITPIKNRENETTGWKGYVELSLKSNHFEKTKQLASKLSPWLQIRQVYFSLSPAAQRNVETRLLQQAATQFRQKAANVQSAFGYRNYGIRELRVEDYDAISHFRSGAIAFNANQQSTIEPIPLASGKTPVSLTLSGSVQMLN